MVYDKEQFKKHYGKVYFNKLKYTLCVNALVVLLLAGLIALGVTLPVFLGFLLPGVIFISLFVLIPVFWGQYTKALRISERQKQWFEDNVLYVLLVPDNGFVWGGVYKEHTKEYAISSVTEITVSEKFIEIKGNIHLTDIYNGTKKESNVTVCKIPRNFTNENKIFEFGGIKNGD